MSRILDGGRGGRLIWCLVQVLADLQAHDALYGCRRAVHCDWSGRMEGDEDRCGTSLDQCG